MPENKDKKPHPHLRAEAFENGALSTEHQDETGGAPRSSVGALRNDPFPHLSITLINVDAIEAAPRRLRRELEAQEAAVRRSMERFGNRIPILVSGKRDGRHSVIDGHSRLAAARQLGAERAPCIVVEDLPDVEIRRLALSLNKLQETGEWDADALHIEISEIIEISGDIEIPGFELPEIEAIQFGITDETEADPQDDPAGRTERVAGRGFRPVSHWLR